MSMFNKFAVMIAFAVCTTNAWAKMCKKQEIKKLNNDKYLYFKADTAESPMMGFVCGGECADGSKIISVDIQAYIAENWLGTSGGYAGSQGYWDASRCSDRKIDSKWELFSDLRNEFKKCTDAQRSEYSAFNKGGRLQTEGGAVRIYCKKVEYGTVGGAYCVSSDPNNETICWVEAEDDQEQVVAVPLTPPEEKTPETKKDCGNVGQRECDGKFYVCKTDADCGSEHLPSHATAGHCVSAGRSGYKVCTATDCGENYELARDKNGNSQGWCRKKSADKNEKADTGENSGAATSTTESGDDNKVTEGESAEKATQEETEKSDDVFAKIDVDLIKYFSKSSVWKNDEGKFNTARLASDSIAGVVLGTTGGIITSNVIKKNQIKKGFEDLKCTIGGQSVAAYGDEFSVGVK